MTEEPPLPLPGWIAQLSGDGRDLEEWGRSLKPPFDPWCERIPRDKAVLWVLRSRSFDELQSADEVRARAQALIDQLNGALHLSVGARPVTFSVGKIDKRGQIQQWVYAQGIARVRARVSGVAAVLVTGERVVPAARPTPSEAQEWIAAAEANNDLANFLTFVGRSDNWIDIYKALEAAERLAGGTEHDLAAVLGNAWSDVKRLKQTANSHRHALGKHKPPTVPITLEEARSLLTQVARMVLAAKAP